MTQEELIRKWLSDELTTEEEKLLQDSEEFKELHKIWTGLSVATPPSFDIESQLQRFQDSKLQQSKEIRVSWQQQWFRIAASILLISVASFLLFRSLSDSQSVRLSESLKTYYLPDSSVVTLNEGSELTYEAAEWYENRRVTLRGEAFFQVEKGSTFEVTTLDGTVNVLGTSFNVKQRAGYFEVICYEGKVAVATSDQRLSLNAGDGFMSASETSGRFDVVSYKAPGWLSGNSSFYRTPLYAVLEELETQYNITIETSDLNLNDTFTGTFPNNNLDIALEAVTIPSGYLYQQLDDKVLIVGGKD